MMGDSMAVGDVPPEWIVPGDARGSRAIEVMNITDRETETTWAWADHTHDDTMISGGVTMSRADRLTLVRMADLGGQYYSRWNVAGATSWGMTEY
jgi:hypothetical protein